MNLRTLILLLILPIYLLKGQTTQDYYSAVKFFQDGRYYESYILFEKFLKIKIPEDELYASAKFYASEALFNLGEYGGAMAGYEYLVNKFEYTSFRAVALYKLSLIYIYNGQIAKARVKLMAFARNYPGFANYGSVLFYLGETYRKEKKYNDALFYYEQAKAQKTTNKFKIETLFYIGECHEYLGHFEEAANIYEEILNNYPDNPYTLGAQIKLGVSYYKAGEYEKAILELMGPDFQNLPPEKKKEATLILASSLFHTKEYQKAEEEFAKLVKQEKDSPIGREAKYGLAWCKFQKEKYDSAYSIFSSLTIGKDSIAIASGFWEAETQRYMRDEEKSLRLFNDYIGAQPKSPYIDVAKISKGILLIELGQVDEAYAVFDALRNVADYGIRAKANIYLGELNSNKKNYVEAITNFEVASQLSSKNSDLYTRGQLGLGVCYFLMESYDKAYDVLRDIEGKRTGFEPDVYNFYLGEVFFKKMKFKESLDYYSRVNPDNGSFGKLSLYGKAYSYFNIKDYQNAKFTFLDYIGRFPGDDRLVDSKVRLAECYYATRDFENSAKMYDNLLTGGEQTDRNLMRYNYALTLFNMGKKDEAIKELKRVIREAKGTQLEENSRFLIGWIYFKSQDYEKALTSYNEFLETSDDQKIVPLVYYNMGDCYYNMEQFSTSAIYYEKVLIEFPNSPQVYDAFNGLFFSYFALGEQDTAFTLIENFLTNNPRLKDADRLYLKRAELFYNAGDFSRAKENYLAFIEFYPASPHLAEAYYWLGKSYQSSGESGQATNSFKWVLEKYDTTNFSSLASVELAYIFFSEGNYEEAGKMIDGTIEKYPKDQKVAELKYLKGMLFLAKGDTLSGYDQFDEVINTFVGDQFADKSYIMKGQIELKNRRYENAVKAFIAVSMRREDVIGAEAQYLLGTAYYEKGDYKDAITAFVRVESVFGEFADWLAKSYLKLADSYVKLKDNKKAISILEKLIEGHPDDDYGKEASKKLKEIKKKKK
jgi:TolA-binding protein